MEHFDYGALSGAKITENNLYRCAHCKKVVERTSGKHWIPSYCEESGRNVRLIRVRYVMLKEGDIIRHGDECEMSNSIHDPAKWFPAGHTVGSKAPSPLYPAHRKYRRLVPA